MTEPLKPLDLIEALYEKGQREFLTMDDTKKLLDTIPEMVGEIRRLRSLSPGLEWTRERLEQAWKEVQGVMLDNMLNAAQKKVFVMAILQGQLANPPYRQDAEAGPIPLPTEGKA